MEAVRIYFDGGFNHEKDEDVKNKVRARSKSSKQGGEERPSMFNSVTNICCDVAGEVDGGYGLSVRVAQGASES